MMDRQMLIAVKPRAANAVVRANKSGDEFVPDISIRGTERFQLLSYYLCSFLCRTNFRPSLALSLCDTCSCGSRHMPLFLLSAIS